MENFYINAMNVENGYTKMHIVKAESKDQAIEIIEGENFMTQDAPYGWEVLHYEYD